MDTSLRRTGPYLSSNSGASSSQSAIGDADGNGDATASDDGKIEACVSKSSSASG
jgi:hypothetical protein